MIQYLPRVLEFVHRYRGDVAEEDGFIGASLHWDDRAQS